MNIPALIPLILGNVRGWQLIILVGLFILLFGNVRRITSAMRNMGKGVHAFRQGLEEAKAEINRPMSDTKSEAKVNAPGADKTASAKDVTD